MRFLPAERFVVTLILALFAIDASLLAIKHVAIDVPGYIAALMTGGSLILIGQYYRRFRHNEGIALATTAAGLFITFTLVGSVFNYLLFPIRAAPIDAALIEFDAKLGYSWPDLVVWTGSHLIVGDLLRFIYMSSMPQLIAVILILGFAKRQQDLHRFLLTGLISALLTICFWSFFPSFGTSSSQALPIEADASLPIIVGTQYGAELVRLSKEGVTYITPKEVLGVIGFPSFHTVMACLSVWFMASFRRLFPLFVLINLIMVPAVLVQGGHHLADVLGGMVFFGFGMVLSGIALNQLNRAKQPEWATLAVAT